LSMKLRLDKERIIVRLTPAEIEHFSTAKFLEEKVSLSQTNHFSFALKLCTACEKLLVDFKESTLMLQVPSDKAKLWFGTNRIGINEKIVTEDGNKISLTIEEDLPRRKNRRKE